MLDGCIATIRHHRFAFPFLIEDASLRRTFASAIAISLFATAAAHADPVGDLLNQVEKLHNSEIKNLDGHLFLGWMQFDEDDPNFVVYLDNRRYPAILDDGRGTSQRAEECRKENFFDENPADGCSVSFDAEYLVDGNGGSVEVSLKIWNVTFKE